ncbi:MAG: branched-chain amino acid transport system ATP-binding protein [Hyphomicrobiaceae bacterium]|jgi:branched-chain amino acid transport system ATP-binding protein
MTEPLLRVQGLQKRFGGVHATDDVNLNVIPSETHAIIGPNGAGKTTLISQLSGQILPDAGKILFDNRDITRLPAYQRAHVGIARSFQITSLFMDMTVQDNVALAVQAHQGHSFRLWRPARSDDHLRAPALEPLKTVGLHERADWTVSELSHGERRQLEMAMALAVAPKLMLLDEPMAGMGHEESMQMVDTLKSLGDQTILLIEHDMDAVFALADRISVLVYGRIVATGTPEEIRSNDEVRRAYLGEAA